MCTLKATFLFCNYSKTISWGIKWDKCLNFSVLLAIVFTFLKCTFIYKNVCKSIVSVLVLFNNLWGESLQEQRKTLYAKPGTAALNCRLILGMLMGIWQNVGKQLTSSTAETFKTKDRRCESTTNRKRSWLTTELAHCNQQWPTRVLHALA